MSRLDCAPSPPQPLPPPTATPPPPPSPPPRIHHHTNHHVHHPRATPCRVRFVDVVGPDVVPEAWVWQGHRDGEGERSAVAGGWVQPDRRHSTVLLRLNSELCIDALREVSNQRRHSCNMVIIARGRFHESSSTFPYYSKPPSPSNTHTRTQDLRTRKRTHALIDWARRLRNAQSRLQ